MKLLVSTVLSPFNSRAVPKVKHVEDDLEDWKDGDEWKKHVWRKAEEEKFNPDDFSLTYKDLKEVPNGVVPNRDYRCELISIIETFAALEYNVLFRKNHSRRGKHVEQRIHERANKLRDELLIEMQDILWELKTRNHQLEIQLAREILNKSGYKTLSAFLEIFNTRRSG